MLGEELAATGGQRFGPPGLQVEFGDGARAVEWRYVDHAVDGGQLRVTLADRHYPLELSLHYRVYPDTDVVERWTTLRHTGTTEGPITVEHCDSAHWTLPVRPGYRLSQVTGEWSAEFQLGRTPLPHGETTLVTRRGTTRHQVNPWLMVDPGDATEEHGEVWSTVLAWSGSCRLTARRTLAGQVTLTGGAGHEGTRWRLQLGERWAGRPDRDPARLRPGVPGGHHGRLGVREPEPAERPAYPAAVPVPCGDGRRAGHQRQPAGPGRPASGGRRQPWWRRTNRSGTWSSTAHSTGSGQPQWRVRPRCST